MDYGLINALVELKRSAMHRYDKQVGDRYLKGDRSSDYETTKV
jgi:hypothetical protein